MIDINCKHCGEPWGLYYINHELNDEAEYEEDWPDDPAAALKGGKGCPVCNWGEKDDVSRRRTESEDKIEADYYSSLFNTDEDPLKYL